MNPDLPTQRYPMRGFPVPNVFVPQSAQAVRNARRWATSARVLQPFFWGLLGAMAVLLAIILAGSIRPPHPLVSAWTYSCLAMFAVIPLTLLFTLKARALNSMATADVVPARLLGEHNPFSNKVMSCLLFVILLPMNFLAGILVNRLRGDRPFYQFEVVQDYRLRIISVRLPRHSLQLVTPGQVIWLVRPARLRAAATWSEETGTLGPRCLVSGRALDWHWQAADKAVETEYREPERRRRIKAIRAIRRRKGAYSKRMAH